MFISKKRLSKFLLNSDFISNFNEVQLNSKTTIKSKRKRPTTNL